MSGHVDVLADLRGVVRIAKAARLGVTGNTPRIERAEAAIVALDKLMTESREALTCLRVYAPGCKASIANLEAALAGVGDAK